MATDVLRGKMNGCNENDCLTEQELAALEGHLTIARQCNASQPSSVPVQELLSAASALESRDVPYLSSGCKSSIILIGVGPANTRSESQGVELQDGYSRDGLLLTISYGSCEYSSRVSTLNVDINKPYIFETAEPDAFRLRISLYESNARDKALLATTVVLLNTLRQGYSKGREGLLRDVTVPILGLKYHDVVATVTFNYLVVRPYLGERSNSCSTVKHGFWKPGGPTQVIGHRGSGANSVARTNLQLGENTVHSLESAAALGACGVEFDVQLTKDFVPVIYHNFLVMESGTENTIWNMTQDQFVNLSKCQGSKGLKVNKATTNYIAKSGDTTPKSRSSSMGEYDDDRIIDMVDRMKLTTAGKAHGIKGNLRGHAIQSLFPTFEELLTKLPESVSFDVEMKYPMLWESQDQDWEPYAPEANLYVDTILSLIYKHAGQRNITFSSFSPEICILLALKQRDFPILFITKAGSVPVGDIRASSLQQAVLFAKRWGLAGVVSFAEPVVLCPRLIGFVKGAGLVYCTYGDANDEPGNARVQAEAGLDAIIVNKIRLISKALAGV